MIDTKKKGLGRGLSALFGDQDENKLENKTNNAQKLALIGDLNRNRFQPRNLFNREKLLELSESIKKNGVIQPIAVREDHKEIGKYEIVAGERRWMAAQEAGLHQVPIVILELSDNEALEVAIVENIQREDLNVIEEAKGFQRLNENFGYDQEKIAKFMSKSRSHISNSIRLLSLPADVVSMLEEGTLTAGQARPLIGLANASDVAEQIVSKKLSSRAVEDLTRRSKGPQKVGGIYQDSNIIDEQKKFM